MVPVEQKNEEDALERMCEEVARMWRASVRARRASVSSCFAAVWGYRSELIELGLVYE